MSRLRILALTRYGRLGASSRVRTLQYLPFLDGSGLDVVVEPLIPDSLLTARYRSGGYSLRALLVAYSVRIRALLARRDFDALWIEKEALPWWPFWVEKLLLAGSRYVLDYDDAVFHYYDRNKRAWVRKLFGRRLDKLMASATMVIAGNQYLADRARSAGAPKVEILPTVVDLERYDPNGNIAARANTPRIVWIGSPSTVRYLDILEKPLRELAKSHQFVLQIIGGEAPVMPGVQVEHVEWSEDSEVEALKDCSIGVMPLLDSPWERGKCGYKIIQYMACGLPVVASPVGVNSHIVVHGENGYLADSDRGWVTSLAELLAQPDKRARMGAAGRSLVEKQYSVQVQLPRLIDILSRSAAG